MRVYFDTEFVDEGHGIHLISIGMIREDGAEYYAETLKSVALAYSTEWHRQNVLPYLRGELFMRGLFQIGEDIKTFVGSSPEFWAYVGAYDWVALMQIYGSLLQRPKGWPSFVRDIKQLKATLGDIVIPPIEEGAHNALADARWVKSAYEYLMAVEKLQAAS